MTINPRMHSFFLDQLSRFVTGDQLNEIRVGMLNEAHLNIGTPALGSIQQSILRHLLTDPLNEVADAALTERVKLAEHHATELREEASVARCELSNLRKMAELVRRRKQYLTEELDKLMAALEPIPLPPDDDAARRY